MSNFPSYRLTAFSFGKRISAILQIFSENHIQTSFCFSQVSVLECLQEFSDVWFRPGSEEIQGLYNVLDKLGIPDFHEDETVVFDEFTSQTISAVVNEIVNFGANQQFFDEQFELYSTSGYATYWLPQKQALKSYTVSANPTGFYLSVPRKELLIFHSKMHSSVLVNMAKHKRVKKMIRRSALCDDCIEPMEFLHPSAAELFGFLFWLNMFIMEYDEE